MPHQSHILRSDAIRPFAISGSHKTTVETRCVPFVWTALHTFNVYTFLLLWLYGLVCIMRSFRVTKKQESQCIRQYILFAHFAVWRLHMRWDLSFADWLRRKCESIGFTIVFIAVSINKKAQMEYIENERFWPWKDYSAHQHYKKGFRIRPTYILRIFAIGQVCRNKAMYIH